MSSETFFVKWAQIQSLGEKWAATSKRLRSTVINDTAPEPEPCLRKQRAPEPIQF